jgi:prepilin-type N-terminal cleavage/methylation domain-containing protein
VDRKHNTASIAGSARRILSSLRRRQSAFTLIELMVAVGLMAIFASMIFTVSLQAGSAFSMARTSVRVHQNARAAFGIMVRDVAGVEFCSYEEREGYLSIGWREDPETGNAVQALTFTTLATQLGAKPLVPGVSPQYALVRYTLRWDGNSAVIRDSSGADMQVPTYDLVKQVRFPQTAYGFCDMGAFPERSDPNQDAVAPDEAIMTDILAKDVYDMRVRIYHKDYYVTVLDAGRATAGGNSTLQDSTRTWSADLFNSGGINAVIRLTGGTGAPDYGAITDTTSQEITHNSTWYYQIPQNGKTNYRIEELDGTFTVNGDPPYPMNDVPTWIELPDRGDNVHSGTTTSYEDAKMYPMQVIERVPMPTGMNISDMNVRMPYLVEVTLSFAERDARRKRSFTFTQRLKIPIAQE